MKTVVCLAGLLGLLFVSFSPLVPRASGADAAKPALAPDVEPLLDRVAAFYKKAAAFKVRVTQTTKRGDSDPREIAASVTLQKPNKLSVEVTEAGEATLLHADGTQFVVYQAAENSYFKSGAVPPLGTLVQGFAPGLDSLVADDPKTSILEGVKSAAIVREEKVGGAACIRVHFEQKGAPADVWIEKGAQPFVRRLTLKHPQAGDYAVQFDDWEINPKLTANTFAFVPPKDAREIKPGQREPVKIEPIKVPEKAYTWADFKRQQLAWCERVVVAPFKARLKGEAWNAAAASFVPKALDIWTTYEVLKPADISEEGRKLIEGGCEDPLVLYLAGFLRYRVSDDWRIANVPFEKAFKKAKDDPKLSRALARFIALGLLDARRRGGYAGEEFKKHAIDWTRASLEDGSYGKDDDFLFVHHQVAGAGDDFFDREFEKLAEIYESPALPEWAQRALRGHVEVKRAWKSRGGGWASEVKEEGWKGFGEHLAKAKTELTQAWKLRPDRPEAATEMITVTMGGGGNPGETERTWFDRAIAAQFDYTPAYSNVLWSYRPRWGGSHEQMFEFGKACLATARFDTEVPTFFFRACNDIDSELEDWRPFYRQPEIAKVFLEASRTFAEHPARAHERQMRASYLAVNAWMAGEYKLAAATLEKVGDKLHPDAALKLKNHRSDEATFRAEVAIFSGPARADFEKAEALFADGKLEPSREAFASAAKKAGDKARGTIDSRLALVDFEREYAKGEWVKIKPDPTLAQWRVSKGDWSADADGTLVNKGDDGQALILFRGRVGGEFELRGEFQITAPEQCCRMLGVAFGWRKDLKEMWGNCEVWQSGKGPIHASLLNGYYTAGEAEVKTDLQAVNRFYIRSRADKLTYRINDQTIFEDHEPNKVDTGGPDGLIGFAGHKFCKKNTTKIRNVEVRRLD